MSLWIMNSLFKRSAELMRYKQVAAVGEYLGLKSTQVSLLHDLKLKELEQLNTFEYLHLDHKSTDVLEKVYNRALGNLEKGSITISEFYRLKHKIADLKKTRFAEDYDGYKVVSSVGGTKARELHKLHAQLDKNERGELAHKLWKQRKETDPAAKGPVGYI